MKYSFRRVSPKEVDSFAVQNGVFRQTSMWVKLKKIFRPLCFIGQDDNGNTVFSCLLLRFYLPLVPYSVCYAPNGFICDYNNVDLIRDFTDYFNKYMKKHFIAYTLLDPEIIKNIDFKENVDGIKTHKAMLDYGYVYEDKKPYQYMQINNNYRLLFDYKDSKLEEHVFHQFSKKLQYDINLCQTRGVTIEKYDGTRYLEDSTIFDHFYKLFVETSIRKNFNIKKEKFYRQMFASLSPYSTIYLAKYNYNIDYRNTNQLINKTEEMIKELKKNESKKSSNKIKELNENLDSYRKRLNVIEEYKNQNPYIGAALFILMGSKSHYLLGANDQDLKFAQPTSLLVWEMIKDSIRSKVDSYNLGGSLSFKTDKVEDDPLYSIYSFKKQLSGELVDYYGDYYLVNSNRLYNFFEKKNRLLKRLNSKF